MLFFLLLFSLYLSLLLSLIPSHHHYRISHTLTTIFGSVWSIFLFYRSFDHSSYYVSVYCLCDGPGLTRGPYLAITTICSVSSLVFVSLKASYVFCGGGGDGHYIRAALIMSSIVLAIGHIVVAYRTSCRERRKLLLYKIDIEAVSHL
ncbi:hypothetical protein MKW98_009520, partial [Papaver atlanticum]